MNNQQLDESFVKRLIETEAVESVHLDFKRGEALYFNEGKNDKREQLAKDVSAFANSDGGVLVYGLDELDHKAHKLTYVDEEKLKKLAIEDVLKQKINKNIEGIEIQYVKMDNDPHRLIVLIRVPRSPNAPHMVGNKFFKRFQTLSAPMEEYEVRDSYFRTSKPILELDIQTKCSGVQQAELKITIRNISSAIAYNYKLNLEISGTLMDATYHSQRHKIREFYIGDRSVFDYSIPNSSPLFPKEECVLVHFNFHSNEQRVLSQYMTWFQAVLYYDGGIEQKSFCLKEPTQSG